MSDTNSVQNSPVVILKKFFGLLPDQTLKDFNEELKSLSPSEKQELADLAKIELAKMK
jgi:hypothetical protein